MGLVGGLFFTLGQDKSVSVGNYLTYLSSMVKYIFFLPLRVELDRAIL
jgi:hypothetical protein